MRAGCFSSNNPSATDGDCCAMCTGQRTGRSSGRAGGLCDAVSASSSPVPTPLCPPCCEPRPARACCDDDVLGQSSVDCVQCSSVSQHHRRHRSVSPLYTSHRHDYSAKQQCRQGFIQAPFGGGGETSPNLATSPPKNFWPALIS